MGERINDPAEVERIADEIIRRYDEVAFAGMQRILDLIRGENGRTDPNDTENGIDT
jgi:hypothetical protein